VLVHILALLTASCERLERLYLQLHERGPVALQLNKEESL
jgi:hypothetical protein